VAPNNARKEKGSASGGKAGRKEKGGKGLPKRHQKDLKSAKEQIGKADIRRLCRAGGVGRISGDVYNEVREAAQSFLDDLMYKTVLHVEHERKVTVEAKHVVRAFKLSGKTAHGLIPLK